MKTVIQVWTQTSKNLIRNGYDNYWGIGDLIRGTIKLYQLSKIMNFRLLVNRQLHPISNYLQQQYSEYDHIIQDNRDNILFVTPGNLENHINNSHSDLIYFLTNDLCDENNITDDCKNFIKGLLQPNDELYNSIHSFLSSRGTNFEILHFRLGDVYIRENYTPHVTTGTLYQIIDSNYKNGDIFMCDSNNFKNQLMNNKQHINILNIDIGHVGYETDLNKIKNTLLEFFIIANSKKIKTFSIYEWVSGYVYWISKIYNIELQVIR
jgi:hypothetical protein